MKKNALFFLLICSFPLKAQFKNFWPPINPEFDSLMVEIEKNHFGNRDTQAGREIVKEMYDLANYLDNPVLLSRAIYWDISNKYIENQPINPNLFLKGINLIDSIRNEYDYARFKYLKATSRLKEGNYVQTYKINKELESYFEEIGDDFMTGKTLLQKGSILLKINEYEKALAAYNKAQFYYKRANIEECIVKNQLNIGNALFYTGRKEEAVSVLKSLEKTLSKMQDTITLINTLYSLSAYSQGINDRLYYTKKNYRLCKDYNNRYLFTVAGINYAASLIDLEKHDSALNYLYEAKKSIKNFDDITARRLIYKNLSQIHINREAWDSAYYYSNLYHVYNDSILGADKVLEINKIETREAIDKIEQKKKEAEQQRKITLAFLFGVCCFSIAVISVIYFRKKKMEMQKKLKEAENEKLETEINSKNRELATNTLLLAEKNRVLEDLSHQLKELEFKGNIPTVEERQIQKKIEEHLHTANEWEFFKMHFESVHPDFFSKLKQQFPSLSENDLRLCAYIRIGMENKQIAKMLSVQPNTVKTSRYRLRKKLILTGEDPLEDFLRNL